MDEEDAQWNYARIPESFDDYRIESVVSTHFLSFLFCVPPVLTNILVLICVDEPLFSGVNSSLIKVILSRKPILRLSQTCASSIRSSI